MNDIWEIRRPESIGNIFKSKGCGQTAEGLPGYPYVVISPKKGKFIQGEIPLPEFKHPRDCIYIFGGDNTPMSEDDLGCITYQSVYIPTIAFEFYSWQAGAIVLYDRLAKQWPS